MIGFGVGAMASYLIAPSTMPSNISWPVYLTEAVKITIAGSSTSRGLRGNRRAVIRLAVFGALLGGGLGPPLGESSKISEGVMRGTQRGAVGLSLAMSLAMAIFLNYFRCSTDSEPYVYVQTYNDIYRLMNPVMRLVRSNPLNYRMVGSFHPDEHLSVSLAAGRFRQCRLLRESNNSPGKFDADFLVVQSGSHCGGGEEAA